MTRSQHEKRDRRLFIENTNVEYYHKWMIHQIRQGEYFTRIIGYRAMRNGWRTIEVTHYRDLKTFLRINHQIEQQIRSDSRNQ